MIVTSPDVTITQILNSYILHSASMPNSNQEKIKHLHYLNDFRTQQCPLFLDHKCQVHRPFACFYWHFPNQRRRRPIKKGDGTFNYNPDVYCTAYDENTGACPNGEECQYVHRNAGDTERRYHPRYFKTGQCIYETADSGCCVKNGQHCAFAHGIDDLRQPVYDVREVSDAVEHIANLPATLEKERVLSEDPQWNDMLYVLAFYKTLLCKKPPRMCRQGYACPFYHNGKDRRRNPHLCRYRSTPCPQVKPGGDEWKDSVQCEAQDDCGYCHTRTEQQFHPEIYKSTKCNDMAHDGFCPRGPFCAFAHSEAESSVGRDFLASPSLLDELVRREQSVSAHPPPPPRSPEEPSLGPASVSAAGEPSAAHTHLFNASVTGGQMGLGMLGLSALSAGTLHYIQSLLAAQSQIIQQYASKQPPSLLPAVATPVTATASLATSAPPYRLLSSACSSDSGLSTTKEDLHSTGATEQPLSPDKDGGPPSLQASLARHRHLPPHSRRDEHEYEGDLADADDDESKYPDLSLIIGHVLGDSFNCSLSEVNSLPDRSDADFVPDYFAHLENPLFYEPPQQQLQQERRHLHHQHHRRDPGAEEEDVCTELGGQFSATSAPLNIPQAGKNYRAPGFQQQQQQDYGSRNWSSQPQSTGSPGGSSGFGDSLPFASHGRFMDQNTCKSASACSPASRMPQSPIMLQSPFNNAACDLEKLCMEKELSEVRSRLSDTERELHSIRHQRDVVLLQLQQSWKLIQSLVGAEHGPASAEGEGEGKENVRVLTEMSKMSARSSTGSSPDQTASLQSSQSTCTLTD